MSLAGRYAWTDDFDRDQPEDWELDLRAGGEFTLRHERRARNGPGSWGSVGAVWTGAWRLEGANALLEAATETIGQQGPGASARRFHVSVGAKPGILHLRETSPHPPGSSWKFKPPLILERET